VLPPLPPLPPNLAKYLPGRGGHPAGTLQDWGGGGREVDFHLAKMLLLFALVVLEEVATRYCARLGKEFLEIGTKYCSFSNFPDDN
jgi:hypothetical protein